MKEYITLEEIKKHLNIDFSDDDTYLSYIVVVAQMSVEKAINSELSSHEMEDGALNPMLKHAIKILAGNFYANREPVSFATPKEIPYTLAYLIRPFKKYK
nr:head-tail connector protein [uncultured Bacteroides sp.]